jgi:hypothetical protein
VRDVDAELHRVRRRCVRARGFVRNGIYHAPIIGRQNREKKKPLAFYARAASTESPSTQRRQRDKDDASPRLSASSVVS